MNEETQRALNAAYAVFARYEAPRYLKRAPGVPHDVRALSRADWQQLEFDKDLSVLFYNDDENVFRHFLPRWLEFISVEDTEMWDMWDVAHHLQRSHWQQWPAPEVAALRDLFLAWTKEETQKYGGQPPIGFLETIGENLAPHLEIWLDADLRGLAEMLWTADWSDEPNLRHWVVASRLESALEAAFSPRLTARTRSFCRARSNWCARYAPLKSNKSALQVLAARFSLKYRV